MRAAVLDLAHLGGPGSPAAGSGRLYAFAGDQMRVKTPGGADRSAVGLGPAHVRKPADTSVAVTTTISPVRCPTARRSSSSDLLAISYTP